MHQKLTGQFRINQTNMKVNCFKSGYMQGCSYPFKKTINIKITIFRHKDNMEKLIFKKEREQHKHHNHTCNPHESCPQFIQMIPKGQFRFILLLHDLIFPYFLVYQQNPSSFLPPRSYRL